MKILVGITKIYAGVSETVSRIIDVAAFDQASTAVPKSVIEAKGDLIVGTGAGTVDNLAVGTDGKLLSADSSESTGLLWVSPGGSSTVDLVNNDAVSHDIGTVVIIDTSIDKGCKKTTAAGDPKVIGVAVESVSAAATGKYMQTGQMTVLVQGNVTRGHWLIASSTSGRAAASTYNKPTNGAIGIAQTAYAGGGAGSVIALVDIDLGSTAPLQKLSTTTSYSAAGTAITTTHVCDPGTDLLVVRLNDITDNTLPTSVTYNGTALTLLDSNGSGSSISAIYYLEDPSIGTYNLVVNLSSSKTINLFASNYAGSIATPFRAVSKNTIGTKTSDTLSPTSAVGDLLIDVYGISLAGWTPTAGGQTLECNGYGSSEYLYASTIPGAAGSTTMSWAGSSAAIWGLAVAIKGS